MARVKTFANGGSLLPGDLNAMEDDYESAFSSYKQINSSLTLQGSGLVNTNIYLLNEQGAVRLGTDAAAGLSSMFLDRADWNVTGRTTQWRLRAVVYTNSTAPTSTFQIGVYNVASVAGGAGQNTITSLGAVLAGSQVSIVAPAALSGVQGNSGDFVSPVPQHYVIGCLVSTTMVANSTVVIRAMLQQRQV